MPYQSRIALGEQKRKSDTVQHTVISLAMIAASTFLAGKGVLSPEMTLAAWTLAAAVIGTPVVVRRLPSPSNTDVLGR